MLNTIRTTLYVAIAILIFMLYQAWEREHPAVAIQPTNSQTNTTVENSTVLPTAIQASTAIAPVSHTDNTNTAKPQTLIHVKTDVLNATIDPVGGQIIGIQLIKYPAELHSNQPVQLLNNDPNTRYIAASGLLGPTGPDTANKIAEWRVEKTEYVLSPNENHVDVRLHYKNQEGVEFIKTLTFKRNDYEIGVTWQIQNNSSKPWYGNSYFKLSRTNTPPETRHGLTGFATYFGAALSTPNKVYQKISFPNMAKSPIDQTAKDGWIAMVQHYFVGAWVPTKGADYRYFSQVSPNGLYTLGALGPALAVQPQEVITTSGQFYAGPAIAGLLEKVAPHLKLTIDYGWLWMISGAIFWLMQKIYSFVGNWGWSIVLVTLIIKLGFYHLSAKSYRSMGALRRLQPKITALRERFGDDKQKLTQATLELYRTEKVNPMSGCLPVLIQIPVFIALYWVLVESIQLRQAPFIFWIHDLSAADPFYVLPILMGLSMFVQQRLSPAPPDPTQAKIMMLMPVFFTAMFAKFPAGLMLYWFVNNSLSCLQQWYVMKTTEVTTKHHRRLKGDKKS